MRVYDIFRRSFPAVCSSRFVVQVGDRGRFRYGFLSQPAEHTSLHFGLLGARRVASQFCVEAEVGDLTSFQFRYVKVSIFND